METDADDTRIYEKGVVDSFLTVNTDLGLTLSDPYGDYPSVPDFGDLGFWAYEYGKPLKPVLTDIRKKTMSLLVGDCEFTNTIFGRLNRATKGHDVIRCRLEEAYVMCNSQTFDLIWLVISNPINQEALSFTTSIRYMYSSRLNKTTKIIGVSAKRPDVDLHQHGIDDVIVAPFSLPNIREIYKKWSSHSITTASGSIEVDYDGLGRIDEERMDDEGIKVEENPLTLPLSPLLAALHGVRESYQPRQKPPPVSDHTTKEKMRRERIKESCDQLRMLLPFVRGRKTDMASVLEICVDYLRIVNIALPTEFKTEVADILSKETLRPDKSRSVVKSTPRKRKRELAKKPETPQTNVQQSSFDDSPMYTPPPTPGSESSDSVSSPMTVNIKIEPSRRPSPEPTIIKLTKNLHAARDLEFFTTQRNPSGGCYSISPFARPTDLQLQTTGNYFPTSLGNNLLMAGLEMEEAVCRLPTRTFPISSSSGHPMDPLANYVNPNAVLPVIYSSPFPNQCLDTRGINESFRKKSP